MSFAWSNSASTSKIALAAATGSKPSFRRSTTMTWRFDLAAYYEVFGRCLAGNLAWSKETVRYRHAE